MKQRRLLLLLIITFGTSLAWSQSSSTGGVRGMVTDSTGAAIVGADVFLISKATDVARHVVSGSDGSYNIPQLSPGNYLLKVTSKGFKDSQDPNVTVIVTEVTNLKTRLGVGSMSDVVVTSEQGNVLQTDSSSVGSVVTAETLTSLPLAKRNYTEVMDLSPGIAQDVNNALTLGRGNGSVISGGIGAEGSNPADNDFEINGADANDVGASGNGFTNGTPVPNPDAIQEFKVQVSGADATYGRDAGAHVNVITKSGTDKFHASAFEFFRNDAMNANDYFFKQAGIARPEVKQNQFGGTVGGPVKKGKVFFFFSYQRTDQVQTYSAENPLGNCNDSITGLPALTNSNRTAAGIAGLYNSTPAIANGENYSYGGAAIAPDGSNVNPVALALFNFKLPNGQYLVPNPQINGADPATGSTLISDGKCNFFENQYPATVDIVQNSRSSFSIKTFEAYSTSLIPFPFATVQGFPLELGQKFYGETVSHTFTISSNMVNQAVAGMTRLVYSGNSPAAAGFSSFGINAPNDGTIPWLLPGQLTVAQNEPTKTTSSNYSFNDILSYTRGKNNVSFGGGTDNERVNIDDYLLGDLVDWFSLQDFIIGQSAAYPGNVTTNVGLSLQETGLTSREIRLTDYNLFAQDNWNITPRLNLNLGIRFEYLGPIEEKKGIVSWIDFSKIEPDPPASGSLQGWLVASNFRYTVPSGVTQLNNHSATYELGKYNPEPRFGFTYQLFPKSDRFLLRGGMGLYHVHSNWQNNSSAIGNTPFGATSEAIDSPTATDQNPFTTPFLSSTSPVGTFMPYYPGSQITDNVEDPRIQPAYSYQYNLNTQIALTKSTRLEIGYLGKSANHLQRNEFPNQARIASPADPIRGITQNTPANAGERAYTTGFQPTGLTYNTYNGNANYNALGVNVTKRMSSGLSVIASYTYSKTLTNANLSNFSVVPGNQLDTRTQYGQPAFDRPQRLIISAVYKIPTPLRDASFPGRLANHWSIAGTGTFQDGNPLTITGTNPNNIGGISSSGDDLAYQSCPSTQVVTKGSVKSKLNNYFNTACIGSNYPLYPDGGGSTVFGNYKEGSVRGPDQHNIDMSLSKTFTPTLFTQHVNLLFSLQAFNVLNSAQFAVPTVTSGVSGFGVISSTSVSPRVLQLGFKANF
jgi:hypothetical protein